MYSIAGQVNISIAISHRNHELFLKSDDIYAESVAGQTVECVLGFHVVMVVRVF